MAQVADDDRDKALWLTLAQSWVRLAEHVARDEMDTRHANDDDVIAVRSSESA